MAKKTFLTIFLTLVLVGVGFYFIPQSEFLRYQEDVIYRGNTVQISVPPCPLQTGSLSVESILAKKSLAQWIPRQHAESYNLLENTATLWREQEFIDDFSVIGRIPPLMHSDNFFWEIIPFPKTSLNFLDRFLVVWRLTFNSACLSKNERQSIKNNYKEYIPFFSHAYQSIPEQTTCPSFDAFCDPVIIAKQRLYEGKFMDLLYNYSPIGIGEEKLHFLIIPKAHRTGFPELTLEEYVEAQEIASKLIIYYAEKNFPIVYLFHKTGKFAGQTVPHWHEHVIFAPNQTNEFWGKLLVMRKMLFGTNPLPDQELKALVNKYRQQVKEAMK